MSKIIYEVSWRLPLWGMFFVMIWQLHMSGQNLEAVRQNTATRQILIETIKDQNALLRTVAPMIE